MMYGRLLVILFIGTFAHAGVIEDVCDTCDWMLGQGAHLLGRTAGWVTDDRLKPEHEQFVKNLINEMGITKNIEIYKLPDYTYNAYCYGNKIYLDEGEFELFKKHKDVLRFTIGHELMHAEYNHVLKGTLLFGASYLILRKLLYAGADATGVSDRLKRVAGTSLVPESTFLSLGVNGAALLAAYQSIKPFMRIGERDADREAQKRLAPFYGNEAIAQGAAWGFSLWSSFKKYSLYEKLFSTHPHSIERIRSLGLSEHFTKSYLSRLDAVLKERVIVLVYELIEGQSLETLESERCMINAQKMQQACNICSIYPASAQQARDMLKNNEIRTYLGKVIMHLKTARCERKMFTGLQEHVPLLEEMCTSWDSLTQEKRPSYDELETQVLASLEQTLHYLNTHLVEHV